MRPLILSLMMVSVASATDYKVTGVIWDGECKYVIDGSTVTKKELYKKYPDIRKDACEDLEFWNVKKAEKEKQVEDLKQKLKSLEDSR